MNKPTNTYLLAALAAMKLVGGPLETCTLELYKSGPVTGGDMAIEDFVVADYDGYANVPVLAAAWGTPFMEDGVYPCIRAALVTFKPTGSTTPNIVLGYFLKNVAGTAVLWASPFPEPRTMNSVTSRCDVIPQFNLKPSSDYGTSPDV